MTSAGPSAAALAPLPKLRPAFPSGESDEPAAPSPTNDESEHSDVVMDGDDDDEPDAPPPPPLPNAMAPTWRVIRPPEGLDLSDLKEALARSAGASAARSGTGRCYGNMALNESDRKARALYQKAAQPGQKGASAASSSAPRFLDLMNSAGSDDIPYAFLSQTPVSTSRKSRTATTAPSRSRSSNARASGSQSRNDTIAEDDASASDDETSSSNGDSVSASRTPTSSGKRRPGPSGLITTAKRTIKREPGLPAFMTPPHIIASQSTSRSTSKIEGKPLTCSACIKEGFVSRTYQRRTNLNRHIRESHTPGLGPVPCSHPGCGMGFSNNYSLRRHQRNVGHLPAGER